MRDKSADCAKGEASMTDFQFKTYLELRDKYDAVVQELDLLRQQEESQIAEEGMSDYQFRRYEKLRDKYEEARVELTVLREENAKLKLQAQMLKALSNDKSNINYLRN